jgi:membrane protease YdiL (CAAX protease family)
MDEKKAVCKKLRRYMGTTGWALLVYFLIMNVAVSAAAMIDAFIISFDYAMSGGSSGQMEAELAERLAGNGWGYIAACILGGMILLLWKKKDFCIHTIWQKGAQMRFGTFMLLLCLMMLGQALFQLLTPLMYWLFGLMGIDLEAFINSATMDSDSFSMVLYAGVFAPFFEEILFRGLVMRHLQPYGKKLAIIGSALLFGIFHGNIVQIPYAFVVGLVLGYVAMEYNIGWAMLLHLINNLVLGDTVMRLMSGLQEWLQGLILMIVIWGMTIAAVICLIVKRKEVAAWFRAERTHPWCISSFFLAPGNIVFTLVLIGNVLLSLLLMK